MIHNLSNSDTILSQYLMEMRDKVIQKDPLRFRNNMMRVGEIKMCIRDRNHDL